MSRNYTGRLLFIVFLLGIFAWQLIPTYQYYKMDREERKAMEISKPDEFKALSNKAIKLGLDLQGGMYLVMEINNKELLSELALTSARDDRFKAALDAAAQEAADNDGDIVALFDEKIREAGADVALYYGDRTRRDRQEILDWLNEQLTEASNRALEVMRNRIDQFGVSEPTIQKQGTSRIVIELAGISDSKRAKDIIGKTALLEFKLPVDPGTSQQIAARVNDYLAGIDAGDDTDADTSGTGVTEEGLAPDSSGGSFADQIAGTDEDSGMVADAGDGADAFGEDTDPRLFVFGGASVMISENSEARFRSIMARQDVQNLIARDGGQVTFHLAKADGRLTDVDGRPLREVYLLKNQAEMKGESIVDAQSRPGDPNDLGQGRWVVNMDFSSEGGDDFARITGANVGKQMAIVLDDIVHSAPNIRERIRGGSAIITNIDTGEEAKDLAIVLRAGSLPAPIEIIEERTVGASLGEDSVNAGTNSTLFGLAIVAIFMIIYYKFSGIVADIALVLNIVILMGFMAVLHATLTLPGIAGIILTIGMAVDANVLIFERIREELDKGKSTRSAIDIGYGRAFITILDANVTTFIAAVVLYNFGSGPIKGFATTLMIGIAASMFTAIFVTRAIFEVLFAKTSMKEISI